MDSRSESGMTLCACHPRESGDPVIKFKVGNDRFLDKKNLPTFVRDFPCGGVPSKSGDVGL